MRLRSLLSALTVPVHFVLASFGPRPPANPNVGLDGASSMHGDTASSDTTPLPGPGEGPLDISIQFLAAACPTVLIRSDGYPLILCTNALTRAPQVILIDKDNGCPLAKTTLPAGSLLGGVYAYLDNEDRLVMVDGNHNIVKVKARLRWFWIYKYWTVGVQRSYSIADAVTGHCGGDPSCDAAVSLSAGDDGEIWFVTKKAVVGLLNDETFTTSYIKLADNETIHNSFSTINGGMAAVTTDRALYMLQDASGTPEVVWRVEYDYGSNRKPGQLSWGTGATPTFFGPTNGTEYVTITDNADDSLSLLVMDTQTGSVVCEKEMFGAGNSGTENSAIGIGNTIIVASTYGYPYPAVPAGVGPAVPANAAFKGGMVRVDIHDSASLSAASRDESVDCDIIWENEVRSSAVPKLSTADELIYTMERIDILGDDSSTLLDCYHFTVLDPNTGSVLQQAKIGISALIDTLQMAGNAGEGGVYWQGTLSGIARIAPK